ncbi:ABC transporter permease [Pseudomonas sp. UL073]|uniref:Transport permease protein n=1 Tax=Zestomonas insulae TaxID=2809017 RepID=A0ABS2IJB3_9GAMM|nr:ABC transporter permease [Pseudomonas insulae]MBM7063161.1 ABC transporter permease [Pseudomonas insulae]
MQEFPVSPKAMVASLWCNRSLIKTLIQREVVGRYRGSLLGILWSFFNPIFMLTVYTFVFSYVFKARWSAGGDSKTEFALVLFCGLMIFNLFAECVNRAPGLILSNANYVKKVVFPLEILPWVSVGVSLFHALISLTVWLIAYIILFGPPHSSIALLPVIITPLVLMVMGLSWILASLGVYLRDVAQFIGIITSTMMFISPIFYPAAALPDEYQKYLYMNPLTLVIEQARDILLWGKFPNYAALALYTLAAAMTAWAGFAWFQRTRKGFADVL